MLTIKISDRHLERHIAKKARLVGKSAQEIAKDILLKALTETKDKLYYQQLNPKENGYIIHAEEIESVSAEDEDQKPFSHVEDTEKYVENIRKNAWRKL